MKQEAFIELCKTWMARDVIMAQRSGLNKELENKARGMFFRQGLCNSNQATGMFTDQYQRCAFIKDPSHSLLYLAVKALSDKFESAKVYFIPTSDVELSVNILKSNNSLIKERFSCSLETVQIGELKIFCIRAELQANVDNTVQEQSLFDLLKFIANWGALATQDKLIQILLELDRGELLKEDAASLALVNDNINITAYDVIKILHQAPLMANLNANDAKCYAFYSAFLENFILGFYDLMQNNEQPISLGEQLLHMQALRRLHLKLLVVQDRDSSYHTCMTSLELAFDEIANMLSIVQPYSKDDLFDSIKLFMTTNLAIESAGTPTSVSIAGSCMQIIHRKLMESLRYLHARNSGKESNVFIMHDMYYEISKAHELEQDFEQSKLVAFHGGKAKAVCNYDGQLVDLMLLNFHSNVNRRKRGFAGHDIIKLLENQFRLRADKRDSKQLIVILDGTMTDLSSQHIRRLLCAFKEHMLTGKLAVIFITSLNKYCQIGFDRFPSGISAAFYAQEHFPRLTMDQITGFEANDAIPQTVTHFLRHVGSSVTSYYRMVHEFSRTLHDDIIPKALYDDKLPIHIDNPYTQDGYNKPWGFMVIRFANDKLTEQYKPKMQAFLNSVGIEYRDGFGFNRSTYSSIGANLEILRVSIGPNASAEQYAKIVKYIECENQNICNYASRMRARL